MGINMSDHLVSDLMASYHGPAGRTGQGQGEAHWGLTWGLNNNSIFLLDLSVLVTSAPSLVMWCGGGSGGGGGGGGVCVWGEVCGEREWGEGAVCTDRGLCV